MPAPILFHDGPLDQFESAKTGGRLKPKSFYLIDGQLYFALDESTLFVFVDTEKLLDAISGLSPGGETGAQLGNEPGKPPTSSGSAGTSSLGARLDHAHPLQKNISGNAETATTAKTAERLAQARTIRLTGAVTGNGRFDGENDCTINTALSIDESAPKFWLGSESQLPAQRDSDTVYLVYEET